MADNACGPECGVAGTFCDPVVEVCTSCSHACRPGAESMDMCKLFCTEEESTSTIVVIVVSVVVGLLIVIALLILVKFLRGKRKHYRFPVQEEGYNRAEEENEV